MGNSFSQNITDANQAHSDEPVPENDIEQQIVSSATKRKVEIDIQNNFRS